MILEEIKDVQRCGKNRVTDGDNVMIFFSLLICIWNKYIIDT